MPDTAPPHDRLIVALDLPSVSEAQALVTTLGDAVSFYKVGLELVLAGGLDLVRDLKADGAKVFLDMKLLDIGNTVEMAVRRAAETGADFLTIHGIDSKTVTAAARGAEGSDLKILGVTVLTSLDQDDLAEQGLSELPSHLVTRRAELVCKAGGHGVIASGQEAALVRAAVGPDALIVTPGIRLPDNETDDQARIATPGKAIRDGASHLVVGRPISKASDPRAAALRFQDEIAAAVGG
jgi:orotidine-5'-phosphate decarboxylase